MSSGVGQRHSSDMVLLWLWYRPADAALIGPLAWEPPYVLGVALKKKKINLRVGKGTDREVGKEIMGGWNFVLLENTINLGRYRVSGNCRASSQGIYKSNSRGSL